MPVTTWSGTPAIGDRRCGCGCNRLLFNEDFCSHCGSCAEMGCRCYMCGQCDNRRDHATHPVCICCGTCSDCCNCLSCVSCETRSRSLNADGTCRNCYVAPDTRPDRLHRHGKFVVHSSEFKKGQFKNNPMQRHISVELEVNKYTGSKSAVMLAKTLNKWRNPVVRDGSIGEEGFEINTNPTNGDRFLTHIKELTDGLAVFDGGCDDRCGMHVHINARGNPMYTKDGKLLTDSRGSVVYDKRTAYTQHDLRRLTLLYKHVERAMFMLCDPKRITSRYSAPCGTYYATHSLDVKDFRAKLVSQMYNENRDVKDDYSMRQKHGSFRMLGEHLKSQKSHKYNKVRYKALNIHSYFMRGTIEFRHHEGTVDYNDIVNWSLICAYLVDKAYTLSDRQVKDLIDKTDTFQCLLSLLPEALKNYCNLKWTQFEERMLWDRYTQIADDIWNTPEQE